MSKKKKDLNNTVQFARDLLSNEGVTVHKIMVEDCFGNIVNFSDVLAKQDEQIPRIPMVNRMLFVKDSYMIADKAYQEMSLEGKSFPSLYAVQAQMKELNNMFDVHPLPSGKGVQERIEGKLRRVIVNMPPIESDELTIKISGDGTTVGSRLHVTNFGFSVITDDWKSDDLILVIAKVPEKYGTIFEVLKDLVHDTKHLNSMTKHSN